MFRNYSLRRVLKVLKNDDDGEIVPKLGTFKFS